MLGNRDLEVLRHILNYCNEINYTIDTFGAEFEIFQTNTIYQNAVALCILQIGELTTHFTDDFKICTIKYLGTKLKH